MNFIVVGVGYTGKRVLSRLPAGNAGGINRAVISGLDRPVVTMDLDSHVDQPLSLTDKYSLLYTVAPSADSSEDPRLARLLELLHPQPARFVYISTSGVYGDCNGRLVNEHEPTSPTTDRAIRRLAAEEMLRSWPGWQHRRRCRGKTRRELSAKRVCRLSGSREGSTTARCLPNGSPSFATPTQKTAQQRGRIQLTEKAHERAFSVNWIRPLCLLF